MLPKKIRDKIERFDEEMKRLLDGTDRKGLTDSLVEKVMSNFSGGPTISVGQTWYTADVQIKRVGTTSFYFWSSPEQISTDELLKPSDRLVISGYHFADNEANEQKLRDFELVQRECAPQAPLQSQKEQQSAAWSAEVRKKVKDLRPVGVQVYCQTDDDD